MSDHVSVVLKEAVEGLNVQQGSTYIDGTFGRGGHTRAILNKGGKVIAFDHDYEAISYGMTHFVKELEEGRLKLINENFEKIGSIPETSSLQVNGILFDFGVNSVQLDIANRGFSFQVDAPLDMRMDMRLGVTAKDLINALGKKELYNLLTTYAQEHNARVIVDAILQKRKEKPIETTLELADLIEHAVGGRAKGKSGKLHPATRTFMALRMAVNDELGSIQRVLPLTLDRLIAGGRLVTIAFHEGEDRLVKTAMREWEEKKKGEMLTKHPLEPSTDEIMANPRSRSAKLRVFEKGGAR